MLQNGLLTAFIALLMYLNLSNQLETNLLKQSKAGKTEWKSGDVQKN